MEKNHAMTIRKIIGTSLLTMLTTAMVMLAPLASAISVDFDLSTGSSDASQGDVTSEECAQLDESLAAAMGCDTGDQVIDFTEYTGQLEGPDASGYDSALTQSTDARDFIQTIVNFALSFLGLIATIIVIYGGIMYVMSRGDEEMATKGKKSIGYAAVGIVIILGSFALVNTLIGAGGGSTNQASSTSSGTTITSAGSSFDTDSVLSELASISEDYVTAYKTYLYVSQEVDHMASMEMPLIVDVEVKDVSVGGAIEYAYEYVSGQDSDYADQYTLIDEADIDAYIEDLRSGIRNIQSEVDTLSDTYEASQVLYDYLRNGSTSSLFKTFADLFVPDAKAYGDNGDEATAAQSCSSRTYNEVFGAGYDLSSGLGVTYTETDVDTLDDYICSLIGLIQSSADSDYDEAVSDLLDRFGTLQDLFDVEGGDSGSSLDQIVTALNAAYSKMDAARTTITANTVRDMITAINDVYVLVSNLQFVNVQLTASTLKGNAPLIVRFNALGTEDPSGITVTDDQIQWDLNGNDKWNTDDGEVSDDGGAAGDATSFIYTEPGTYRAKVRVVSSESNIAAGLAILTVVVEPAKSILVLDATAGGEVTHLADFRTFPYTDRNTFKVTMAEAEEGLSFDASQSTDGDNNALVYAEWDFGNNETFSGDWSTYDTIDYAYGAEGKYNASLTVTDKTGVEDRKYFTVYVASPAARLVVSPSSGKVGDTFKFDATGSSTDVGSIVSYQWSASLDGVDYDLTKTSGSTISEKFTKPGIYTITLTVTDSNGDSDTTTSEVLVESQSPIATYDYIIPKENQPATVQFDASDSYDPDEGDTINYVWDFDGTSAEDYTIIDGDSESSKVTVQYLKTGNYSVALKICDQHEDELQKCDTETKTVQIESVLDIDMEVDGDTARHLDDNGEAVIEFTAYSENATGFEIDYGDGETDFTESISRGQAVFTHTYTDAGVFYAELTAYDDNDNKNSITRRVYVANGDSPIAVINVTADGEDIGFGGTLTGNVNTKFAFDAGDSINVDGSTSNLSYSWNFGDGTTSSQKSVTHTYDEHTTYSVTLTVKDKSNPAVTDTATVSVRIEGLSPKIRGLSVTPQGDSLETPLKVTLSVNATDDDGEITYVKGWYYDLNDSAKELGTVIAQTTSFTLTVNTKGQEGDQVEYGFAVEVTDNDNNTVSSFDELGASEIPTLEVTNGPNDTPVANFSVDKSSVYVGDEINFSSTSYDPDGTIVAYWWDVEGDGFYNNEQQEDDSFTYAYSQYHPDGIDVQLKVEDDAGATAVSDTVTIYIDANSDPPEAKFLTDVNGTSVTFRNNSTIDEENGASLQGIYWDFDLATDGDGNGVTNDDFDSFEEEPTHDYGTLGTYEVTMTVVDSTGQTDSVTQEITLADAAKPTADFTTSVDGKEVSFKNQSTVDEAAGVEVRDYIWDFDLATDSDGDGDPENDVDSSKKNVTHTYEEYGDYEVMLTVVDSYGKEDTYTDIVELNDPDAAVEALLTSSPRPNDLSQILVTDDPSDIIFYFSADKGSGDYIYQFDKNIFYDTNGDGIKDNDVDYETDSSGAWTTTFYESYGQIVVKLTVTDNQTGDSDVATLQVAFEGSLGSANLLNVTPGQMAYLLLSALLAAALGTVMTFRYKPIKK